MRLERVVPRPRLPVHEHVERHLGVLRDLTKPYDDGWRSMHDSMMEKLHGAPSSERFVRYRAWRDDYLKNVKELLPILVEGRNARDLYIPVDLVVDNGGSAVADAVRVVVSVPLHAKIELEMRCQLPRLPKPPPSPYSTGAREVDAFANFATVTIRPAAVWNDLLRVDARAVRLREWQLDAAGRTAAINIGDVRHAAGGVALPRLYIVLGSFDDVAPFGLAYELHAHNLRKPMGGDAPVVLAKGEKFAQLSFSATRIPSFARREEENDPPEDDPGESVDDD
jgi:hypothetical protein